MANSLPKHLAAQPLQMTITSVSSSGAGVAQLPDGKRVFVPGTWSGDTVMATIVTPPELWPQKRYLEGRLQSITTPSVSRIKPVCPHSGAGDSDCPCCPWMGIDYQAQLEQKQAMLLSIMHKLSVPFAQEALKDMLASPAIQGHRRRAQFKCDGEKIGYINSTGNDIIAINDCPIMTDSIRQWLASVASQLPDARLQPSRGHQFNFIDLDDDVVSDDQLFPINLDSITLNQRRPFKQANEGANTMILAWLKEKLLERQHQALVLELFAGRGNLTQTLLPLCQKLWSAEVDASAVAHLQLLCAPHRHAHVMHDNLFDLQGLKCVLQQAQTAQGLVLNPPRDGLKMRNLLLDELPNLCWIAYISCVPEKMLADVKAWSKRWRLVEVRGIDQFPHTPHLEAVALLEKI